MKPPPFRYSVPTTAREAVAMLGDHRDEDARVLAGGQSLVPLMNFRLAQPAHLVDLGRVPGLDFVRRSDGTLAVGAMTRQAAMERSPEALAAAPLLVEASRLIAHPPIRHRGTVGGSVAHADPAAELPAVALAMDAQMIALGERGERAIPAAEFFTGTFSTALGPAEILTEVRFRGWPAATGHAFLEFSRTHGNFALVGAAALVLLEGAVVARATLALCGVGDTPIRAHEAERLLEGHEPSQDAVAAAAETAAAGLHPAPEVQAGTEYRRKLARTYARRALELAVTRARTGP